MPKSNFTKDYEQFRALLVDARKRARLRQVDLAEKLSKPQSYVSKVESGERRVDVVEFLDISRAIGIDPARFVGQLARRISPRSRR